MGSTPNGKKTSASPTPAPTAMAHQERGTVRRSS